MFKRCHLCGSPLREKARPDAIYCSTRCRNQAHRHYQALARLPAEIIELQRQLEAYAPEEAVSYRVGLDADPRCILYFPASDRASPRWDGSMSRRGYFRLRPLEPPVVPRSAIYGLQFFDRAGEELATPPQLAAGIALVPLLEGELEGDRWEPRGDWYVRPRHRSPARISRGR